MVALRKIRAGFYATLDGRFQIEHQDGWTECSHPMCDVLHRDMRRAKGDVGDMHLVPYVSWHVWDMVRDDYALHHDEFETKREAHQWLSDKLEKGELP